MIIRFDDICANSNIDEVVDVTNILKDKYNCDIIWAVSLCSHKSESKTQRVFPSIYSAHSDHGMWIQGQLRSKESQPWYRSCYCTLEYVKEVSNKIENFLGLRKNLIEMNRIAIAFQLGKTYSLSKREFFCGVT